MLFRRWQTWQQGQEVDARTQTQTHEEHLVNTQQKTYGEPMQIELCVLVFT